MNERVFNSIEEEGFVYKLLYQKIFLFFLGGGAYIHYFVSICAPLDPVLSQLNLVYISTLQYRTF
jgi:hypothetical protein